MRRIILVLTGIGWGVATSFGQVQDRSSVLDRALDQRALQGLLGRESGAEQVRGVPMESAIDPHRYILGPSDVLFVGLWGPVTTSHTVTVTPEGTLIIPNVGEARVLNTKLADAKKEITSLVNRRYPTSVVTVTLLRPRSFLVSVTGNILNPGQFEATPVDRVEKVVVNASRVFLPSATVTVQATTDKEAQPPIQQSVYNDPRLNQVMEIFGSISSRNIKVFRRGDTLRVDIPKFYATRDDRYNPFLLDGDVVFVPRKTPENNFLGVYGAVNLPGVYEFVENDSLSDALLVAGGPISGADLRSVRVLRMNEAGEPTDEFAVDQSTGIRNLKLQKGDRVVVGQKQSEIRDFRVNVVGEVRTPGFYPVTNGKTTLTKIIRDAGGLKPNALLSGAVLFRAADRLKESTSPELTIARYLRAHNFSQSDSVYFFSILKAGSFPVSVDFSRLFEQNGVSEDIVLMDGDIVYIPSSLAGVLMQGQVARPGYLPFAPGAAIDHYVQRAGGYSEYADEGEVRIIKKSTLEWVDPAKTTIESGDQIWVPKKYRREFLYYFSIVRDVATTLGAIGTLIILAIQVSR